MRQWRYEHQGKMWTKGSRARCFGRFFCCTIMIFLFLLISIVLSLALVCGLAGVERASMHRVLTGRPCHSGSARRTSSWDSRPRI